MLMAACSVPLALACGSKYGSEPTSDARAPDDGTAPPTDSDSDGARSDAGDGSVARCDPTKPFATPTPAAGLNSDAGERFLHVLPGETAGMFTSYRDGIGKLYYAPREPDAGAFGPVSLLFATSTNVSNGFLYAENLELVYATQVTDGGGAYITRRPSAASVFPDGLPISGLPVDLTVYNPYVTRGGLAFWFAQAAPDRDLYVATRASLSAPFGPPARIAELATSADDLIPVVRADEREIFFTSMRSGPRLPYHATRNSVTDTWSPPTVVEELVMGDNPVDVTWVSDDGCVIAVQRLNDAMPPVANVYVATRGR